MTRRRRTRHLPGAMTSISGAARFRPFANQLQIFASISAIDSTTKGLSERATELLYLAEDLATDVRTYRDSIDFDPARLAVVEERLAEIRQLQRKYGRECRRHSATMLVPPKKNWRSLTGSEVDTETLAARADALSQEVGELAAQLSEKRLAWPNHWRQTSSDRSRASTWATPNSQFRSIGWKTLAAFPLGARR